METELIPKNSSRKSFYNKARVRNEEGKIILKSYYTDVAYIKDGVAVVLGVWGGTTTSHIKEFLKQNGFKVGSGEQMFKDYSLKE